MIFLCYNLGTIKQTKEVITMTQKTKNILKGIGFAVCILLFIAAIPVMSIITVSQTEKEPKPIADTRIVEAIVEEVSTDGTNVLLQTNDGNLWGIDNDTEMYRGQQVIIELSDNGTPQVEDDEILNVWLA